MKPVKIVLVEWMGYPLFRKKRIGDHEIHCGLGHLVSNMGRHDAGAQFDCTVIVNETVPDWRAMANHVPGLRRVTLNTVATNSRKKYEDFLKPHSWITNVIFRGNRFQDIGAYDHFYQLLLQEGYTGDVIFANSSVRGPFSSGWLSKFTSLFAKQPDAGFCGISLNSHNTMSSEPSFAPHVQSFLLYTNMHVLKHVFPSGLVENGALNATKSALVEHGEIGLSRQILSAGYGISCAQFPDFFYKTGMPWTIPEGDFRFIDGYRDTANVW